MNSKPLLFSNKEKNFISLLLVLILCIQCMSSSGIAKTQAKSLPDTQKPSTPYDFNVIATSGSAITLATTKNMKDYVVAAIDSEITFKWKEADSNAGIEGYEIWCNNAPAAYTDKMEYTFYDFTGIKSKQYCVIAYDKLGIASDKSNSVHVLHNPEEFHNDNQAPSKPENAMVEEVSGTAVRIEWRESTDNIGIECYKVYKNGKSLGFTRDLYFLDDEELINDEYKIYTIAAYDLAGNVSELSEPAILTQSKPYFDFMMHKTDRFIVKYKNSLGRDNLHSFLKDDIKEDHLIRNKTDAEIELIILKEKVVPKNFINQIVEKGPEKGFDYYINIEYMHEDYQFIASSLEKDAYSEQDIEDIDNEISKKIISKKNKLNNVIADNEKMNIFSSGKGKNIVVAVLDTGIDITHNDLKNNFWKNNYEKLYNNIDDDNNGFIDDVNGWNFTAHTNQVHNDNEIYDEWHGTHLAGIISNVAPESIIMPLKVFHEGMAYTSDIISAINYAEEMGARIVNCSWESTDYNPVLKDVIDHSDMIFVCAAGNGYINIDKTPVYPAAFDSDNIITVAAIDQDGKFAKFSNYGMEAIDYAVLGEDILSTKPDNSYGYSSGTSMAAAFAAGEVALLIEKFGNDVAAIRSAIRIPSDRLFFMTEHIERNVESIYNNISNNAFMRNKLEMNISAMSDTSVATVEIKSTMPDSFYGLASVDLDQYIYVFGGRHGLHPTDTNKVLDSVYRYSVENDRWDIMNKMNLCRFQPAATTANGKIYVFGGHDGNIILNSVEEYDPINNTWSMKTQMPTARTGACAVALDNLIYVVGGSGNDGSLSTVEIYNTQTDTWSNAPNMITARAYAAAEVIENKIYIAGGSSGNNIYRSLEIYDPVSNEWKYGASMAYPKTMGDVATISGRLFAVGGLREFPTGEFENTDMHIETAIEEYIPQLDSWITNCYLEDRYFGFGVSSYENEFYVLGGTRLEQDFSSNHLYVPQVSAIDQFIYIYDQNNRLTEIKRLNKIIAKLNYDKNGNLLIIQKLD